MTWGQCGTCYKPGTCDTQLELEGSQYSWCDGDAGGVLWQVEGERQGGPGSTAECTEEDPDGCGDIWYGDADTQEEWTYQDDCRACTGADPDDFCTT